jgi:hypothetical protein
MNFPWYQWMRNSEQWIINSVRLVYKYLWLFKVPELNLLMGNFWILLTHFWHVLMLKYVTDMKIQVFWDLKVSGWVGVTGWCSEGTWDFEMLGGCDLLMFWRDVGTLWYWEVHTKRQSVTSERIWIFIFTTVTHSSLIYHCPVTKARITC